MLVGVTGKAGAGKDEFAKYFIEHGWARLAFADPIKRMIEAGFDLTPGTWEDREEKEKPLAWLGKSPRYLAQTLGTDWGRETVHPEVWLLLAEQAVLKNRATVVTDVRFDNEARWIRDRGGVVVRVLRPDNAHVVAAHRSENGVQDAYINRVVVNDGTIADLRRFAARVLNDVSRGWTR